MRLLNNKPTSKLGVFQRAKTLSDQLLIIILVNCSTFYEHGLRLDRPQCVLSHVTTKVITVVIRNY